MNIDAVVESAGKAWLKYLGGMALALLPLLLLSQDPHWLNIIAFTYLMGGLAAAWNIIGGFGGQFSLGHGVFFGIGAYATAFFTTRYGLSPWLITVRSGSVSGVMTVPRLSNSLATNTRDKLGAAGVHMYTY